MIHVSHILKLNSDY